MLHRHILEEKEEYLGHQCLGKRIRFGETLAGDSSMQNPSSKARPRHVWTPTQPRYDILDCIKSHTPYTGDFASLWDKSACIPD